MPDGAAHPAGAFDVHALWDWELSSDAVAWTGSEDVWGQVQPVAPMTRAAWIDRLDPDDASRLRAQQVGAFDRGAVRWQCEYTVAATGRRVREQAFIARDRSGPRRVVGTLTPLGASEQPRRRATLDERLERSEQRFETFVETIPQLAWQATPDGWI